MTDPIVEELALIRRTLAAICKVLVIASIFQTIMGFVR